MKTGRGLRPALVAWVLMITSGAVGFAGGVEIKERPLPTIRVGGGDSFAPYHFNDIRGEATGFDVELLRAVARETGLDLEIELGPWKEARDSLLSGKTDLLVGMSFSSERASRWLFSTPFITIRYRFFVRSDSGIGDEIRIGNRGVIVQRAGILEDFVRESAAEPIIVDSAVEGLGLLVSGKNSVYLGSEYRTLHVSRESGFTGLKRVGDPIVRTPYGFAARLGEEVLIRRIDEGLALLNASGEYAEIYQRWFGVLEPKRRTLKELLGLAAWIFVPLLLLLMVSVFWTRTLKHEVRRKTRALREELGRRELADLKLRESEEKYRVLADNSADIIWMVDVALNFTYVSPGAQAVLGYTPEELIGKNLSALVESEALVEVAGIADDLVSMRSESTRLFEVEVFHRDGHLVPAEVKGRALLDDEGEPIALLGIARDITERKRNEEDRLALERQMQHSQKLESLGVLAGGIAHDFNNLLMGVLGNAEMALSRLPPASPARGDIEGVETAAIRAAELAKQMLAYSGRGAFVVKPVDLFMVVEEMAHLLRSSISKQVDLNLDLSRDLPTIQADATQLRQVIMNLIINASEAIGEEVGSITVTTRTRECRQSFLTSTYVDDRLPEGLYVCLEVRDTGDGMNSETREKMFEPFFSTKFTGRGLGLAALLGIVRGHKGAVTVDSEEGQGTTVTVVLPASREQASSVEIRSGETKQLRGSGTILLVDDEEIVREVTGNMLEFLGFTVLMACDGEEAVDVFRENADEIVLVLLDMKMPRMDGERAFEEIRSIRGDAHIILSSGYNEEQAARTLAGQGLSGFIQKPYNLAELQMTLQRGLRT